MSTENNGKGMIVVAIALVLFAATIASTPYLVPGSHAAEDPLESVSVERTTEPTPSASESEPSESEESLVEVAQTADETEESEAEVRTGSASTDDDPPPAQATPREEPASREAASSSNNCQDGSLPPCNATRNGEPVRVPDVNCGAGEVIYLEGGEPHCRTATSGAFDGGY